MRPSACTSLEGFHDGVVSIRIEAPVQVMPSQTH